MVKRKGLLCILGVFSLVVIGLFYLVSAGDVMSVEANIFASNSTGSNNSVIRVEVPDSLFFGNITEGGKSDELKVYINNTGSVDISVTPDLMNNSEEIFDNLYFRKFKTSNGSAVPFSKIGSFSMDIAKPSSGQTYNDAYFYVILDLTNYSSDLGEDLLGHRANVKFIAVQK